jgi:hypothetical protein
MKLTIVHDRDGNILSLVAYPTDAPPAIPHNADGFVTQIDAPDVSLDLGDERIAVQLADLRENYRFDAGRSELTAK